jgi:hypothetical protein
MYFNGHTLASWLLRLQWPGLMNNPKRIRAKRKDLMDRCTKRSAVAEDAEPCDRSLRFSTNGATS